MTGKLYPYQLEAIEALLADEPERRVLIVSGKGKSDIPEALRDLFKRHSIEFVSFDGLAIRGLEVDNAEYVIDEYSRLEASIFKTVFVEAKEKLDKTPRLANMKQERPWEHSNRKRFKRNAKR